MITGQMRIPQSHGNGLVSQQVFDGGQVHTAHDQPTGKGMPQVMKGEILHTRFVYRSFKSCTE
jgi:hypothetical protein